VTKNQSSRRRSPTAPRTPRRSGSRRTPLLIGTSPGLSALPNLTTNPFTAGKTNGAPAALKSSEQIQLIDSNNHVIGTPSAPNATSDGFSLCTWATSC